jgi:hypothetical protein
MAEQYYKLYFDDQGSLLNPDEQEAIISTLLDSVEPVTDLWIFSHGWNTDREGADATYDNWVSRMQERIRQEIIDSTCKPAFVGVYWPSMAWSDNMTGNITPSPSASATDRLPSIDPGEFEFEETGAVLSGYTDEWKLGGEESPFEAGKPEIDRANATSNVPGTSMGKARFLAAYRDMLDPRGEHAAHFDQDFSRLYDLIYQPQQPSTALIEEFVHLLYHYKVDDPHSDPLENISVLNAPERVIARLKAELETPSVNLESFGPDLGNILLSFLRVFTFWTMKGRAAILGQNGVASFLRDVKHMLQLNRRRVGLHLLGHSFGAKLVTATVLALADVPDMGPPIVDTLILLLGAFSQFSFSSNIVVANGEAGHYAHLIERELVKNPIVAIYSQYDLANLVWYPLGMRLADPDTIYEWGDPQDRFGAMGANGAQGLKTNRSRIQNMLPLNASYHWNDLSSISCLNINGQRYINKDKDKWPLGAHGDTDHPEIFHLALAISRLSATH